jgi:predicted permease
MWRRIVELARSLRTWHLAEQDLDDEIRLHVETRANDMVRAGARPADALRRARMEFGPPERVKEDCRDARFGRLLRELAADLRSAWRQTRRTPGFVAVAVLSLTLGIGANVAVFAIVNHLLLAPLPVHAPQQLRLAALSTVRETSYRLSYPQYATLREQFPLFTTLFGWGAFGKMKLTVGDRITEGQLVLVTGNFFDGLGVRSAIGRLITPEDDRVGGGSNVAVLGYGTWQRLFGADPAVLGRSIKIGRLTTAQVIGVTPPEFVGPEPSDPVGVYVPVHAMQRIDASLITGPGLYWMHVMGRLKPDVPPETAQTRLRDRWAQIDKVDQARRGDNTRPDYIVLENGSHGYSDVRIRFSRPVVVLMALVGIIFLVACGNIATLLFVRASRRTGELAVRIALGAGRAALVRQWMAECLLLAVVGGVAGLLAARWITDLLLQFVPEANRDALRFRAGPEVLLFTTSISVAAAGIFGWLPTLRASRVNPNDVLRASGPSGLARGRLAELVLAGQLAASVVLVVGALLFAQTLWRLNYQDAGYERQTVVYARPDFWGAGYPPDRLPETMRQILERVRSSPLFMRVAVGPVPSGGEDGGGWVRVPGYILGVGENNFAYHYLVSPGYFGTVSIPLLAGRDFEERDAKRDRAPVIVSNRLARHYFGTARAAVGKQLSYGPTPFEVVGVVADIIDGPLRTGVKEIVYWPISGTAFHSILARLAPGVDVRAAEAELRASISSFAKAVPVKSGRLEDAVQESLRDDRLVGELSVALGLLGVLLASIGLFGAVAHWAAGRSREIAIRLTLGATPGHIARLVFRRALAIIGLGLVAGVPAAMAAATLIQPLLFGVTPRDAMTYAIAIATLVAVGLLAVCWPAWRAARVEALAVLRWE